MRTAAARKLRADIDKYRKLIDAMESQNVLRKDRAWDKLRNENARLISELAKKPSKFQNETGWKGLANIYSILTGFECDENLAMGLAASAANDIVRRLERARVRIDELWNENRRLREEVRVANIHLREKEQHIDYLQRDILFYKESAKRHVNEQNSLSHENRNLREKLAMSRQAVKVLQESSEPRELGSVSQNPPSNPPSPTTSNQPDSNPFADDPKPRVMRQNWQCSTCSLTNNYWFNYCWNCGSVRIK